MKPTHDNGLETTVRSHDALISPAEYAVLPHHPLILILDNLRSAFNVGSIFRTADASRIDKIILCGYTPRPPNPKLQKTSMGTLDFVKWEHVQSARAAVIDLKAKGIAVFALETVTAGRSIFDSRLPRPVALVLGNEALGVSQDVLRCVDGTIEIPVFGFKNSLNVASAAAIAIFETIRGWGRIIEPIGIHRGAGI